MNLSTPELRVVGGGNQKDTKRKQQVKWEEGQECSGSQENKECKREANDQLAESFSWNQERGGLIIDH